MGFSILEPAFVWTCASFIILVSVYAVHQIVGRYWPDDKHVGGGLLHLRRGPIWLRYFWSTAFIFIIAVPFFVFVVIFALSGVLSICFGWSYVDSFHYHVFTLGMTKKNLGQATDPTGSGDDLVNVWIALIGTVSMYVLLGMAGMTSLTRRIAFLAPTGLFGLFRSIFVYYPLIVVMLSAVVAAFLSIIEGWPYLDSFLMMCGWFCSMPLDINGRHVTSDQAMFMITLCHMIAISMKLSVCNVVYANTFPRKLARWIDGAMSRNIGMPFEIANAELEKEAEPELEDHDPESLLAECQKLRAERERLRAENQQLKVALGLGCRDLADVSQIRDLMPTPNAKANVSDHPPDQAKCMNWFSLQSCLPFSRFSSFADR